MVENEPGTSPQENKHMCTEKTRTPGGSFFFLFFFKAYLQHHATVTTSQEVSYLCEVPGAKMGGERRFRRKKRIPGRGTACLRAGYSREREQFVETGRVLRRPGLWKTWRAGEVEFIVRKWLCYFTDKESK